MCKLLLVATVILQQCLWVTDRIFLRILKEEDRRQLLVAETGFQAQNRGGCDLDKLIKVNRFTEV